MKKVTALENLFTNFRRSISLFFVTQACLFFLLFVCSQTIAQTFPTSCTSGDLSLLDASLPAPANDPCKCSGDRVLVLGIRNGTGSFRTSFALWGTLIRKDASGNIIETSSIFACASGIEPKKDNYLNASTIKINGVDAPNSTALGLPTIHVDCGQSLDISNMHLAWTSASPSETCAALYNSPSTINPKCGTQALIHVGIGVDADFPAFANPTCANGGASGSITVAPSGGKAPYKVKLGIDERTNIAIGGTATFTALAANTYSFLITDANGCTTTKMKTLTAPTAVTADAGANFTITCTSNPNGKLIGESSASGFTYSWAPADGLSSSTSSNPTANPSSTTTYTLTKTNSASGCTASASVTVTVDKPSVTAVAGDDFTKNCNQNSSGKQIGETSSAGFTYSWSPADGLSSSTSSNPTANPSSTSTYTVTKTHTSSGCSATDQITVTVDKPTVTAVAGDDFTKSCNENPSGKQIGESSAAGFTYSWSPADGLSSSTNSNPTANPSSTITYTVTKTHTSSGCSATDEVTVTVNKPTVTAAAGADFTKNCTLNAGGKEIGAAPDAGFTYSWSPSTGLSSSTASQVTANPSSNTTYVVTKTHTASGCSDDDDVIVTVNTAAPSFTVCIVQPTLCSTGSLSISASGTGLQYSIDGGSSYQSNGGSYTNLGANSVTSVKVKNSDGCESAPILCDNLTSICGGGGQANRQTTYNLEVAAPSPTVEAYPNPFSDRIKFLVNSSVAGNGSLEVYNMMGQKIKTVYTGLITAGPQTFELSLPSQQVSNLVYVLRVGDKKVAGKILQINQ